MRPLNVGRGNEAILAWAPDVQVHQWVFAVAQTLRLKVGFVHPEKRA